MNELRKYLINAYGIYFKCYIKSEDLLESAIYFGTLCEFRDILGMFFGFNEETLNKALYRSKIHND